MRLIDADELIEYVWRDRVDSRERIANLVESMPTVRETEGVWTVGKFTEDARRCTDRSYRCDECKTFSSFASNYCPNCGTKMKGVKVIVI